jgi:hypothetical protein
MSKPKQSGHLRLKAALVLRDALAFELKIPLQQTLKSLMNVEKELGIERALHEGKYLDAVCSLCSDDTALLIQLDAGIRDACIKARLAPRYAQYMALLFFAGWLYAKQTDEAGFIERLNLYLAEHPSKLEQLPLFTAGDLQYAAYWMATAAGKTHVLHACLALLAGFKAWDRIIIVTPSEALTRQHADKLRDLDNWDVFAYPADGDMQAIGRLPADTVIVLDINKLTDGKKGEGVTIPTTLFKDGRNLVFVDEGHKGQKSEESTWKRLQDDLAGIDSPQERHRGLLIEFSATFGQVAELEHAFERYAKSVVFDYAYDRFHADLYGKDFWHVKLDGQGDIQDVVQQQTLTAALLSFWHQMKCWRSGANQKYLHDKGMLVSSPLWVLLGLSVIGGKNKSDQEQTSDVIDVLRYFTLILENPGQLQERLRTVLDTVVDGSDMLPLEVRSALIGQQPEQIAPLILSDVFSWQAGDKPVYRLLKGATGEMGLGLVRGDAVHYFGVVNVGDAAGLKKALDAAKLPVDEDAFCPSLFNGLNESNSGINILLGSRRFAEGWDNYRASSMTLLRLGQGEGSLIIQMFGRVVRFAGKNNDGKRLDKPSMAIKPLQTAYLYGLKSAYLETFLNGLYANGIPEIRSIECPTFNSIPSPTPLKSIRSIAPAQTDFTVHVKGGAWLKGVNKVRISHAATVTTAGMNADGIQMTRGVAGQDITAAFKKRVLFIDYDAIYRELAEMKRHMRWWNFAFDKEAIQEALASDRYEIFGLPSTMQVQQESDVTRIHRMAATLVRRLFEAAYRKQESRQNRYSIISVFDSGIPEKYRKDFIHGEEA